MKSIKRAISTVLICMFLSNVTGFAVIANKVALPAKKKVIVKKKTTNTKKDVSNTVKVKSSVKPIVTVTTPEVTQVVDSIAKTVEPAITTPIAVAPALVAPVVSVVKAEDSHIDLPFNSMWDEVLKLNKVTLDMSDGTKTQGIVRWSMPEGFSSMKEIEYNITGMVADYGVEAKATLKIVNIPDVVVNNGASQPSNSIVNTPAVPSIAAFKPTLLDNDALALVTNNSDEQLAYELTGKLSNPKYGGRLAGTDTYNSAAGYLATVFDQLHLSPAGDTIVNANRENVTLFTQGYNCNIAQFNSMPTLRIDGTNLKIFDQFKPHGNTAEGTISGNQEIFMGYGYPEDYTNVDVAGKIVVFMSAVKPNASELGGADRAIYAKTKGATAVLMLPNQFLTMNTFEKPLKYASSKVLIDYISKDTMASLGFSETTTIGTIASKSINGTTDIKRIANTTGYNVLGLIHGKDTSKTVVLSASLDSYGNLPDGTTFDGASTSAAGVGDIVALAKYYMANQPNYNILIAAFGGQAVGMEGSVAFVNNYKDLGKVVANIDIYDAGGQGGVYDAVGIQYNNLHTSVAKYNTHLTDVGENVNYPFGNNYEFSTKGIPSVFIRYAESNDSFNDTFKNVNKASLVDVINHVKNVLGDFMKATITAEIPVVFDSSKVTKELVPSIKETLNVFETDHTKIYWEDSIPTSAIQDLVKSADNVYAQDLWWNYTPDVTALGKVKIYIVDGWDEGYIVTNRTDKFGTGEKSGGYQSFTDFSIGIVRNSENVSGGNYDLVSTFAHEFNHVSANKNGLQRQVEYDNQESSGHVYAFTTSTGNSVQGTINMFKSYVSELAPGYNVASIDWSEYTGENDKKLTNPTQWNIHYNRLASLEYYIWQTYGAETARDIQYTFYQNPRPSVQSVLETKLHKDFNTILNEWHNFYNK